MKIKTLNTLLLFLALFFVANSSAMTVMAQTQTQELNLSVSPPISYLQVPPGTSRNHTIILENSGDESITVSPSIVDFSSDGKTGRAIISNELSFPYISFGMSDIKELSIPAHKKAQLTLYIDVPKDAVEREYPLTILFFSKKDQDSFKINQEKSTTSDSQINGAIGSNLVVLVSKESKLKQVLKVIKLNTPKLVDSFGKIQFSPLIKNESFASVPASGSAKIVNWKKDTLVEFDIYPDIILGTSSREIRALRPGILPDKPETGSFSYKPGFLLGPYQILISLENNQQMSTPYVEVIYAFPFSIVIITIVGIAISFVYFKKIKQKL